jgi:hypothetical protein
VALDSEEAKNWSTERIKFEIETRRQDMRDAQQELSDIRMEFAEDPDSWGGSHPCGLDSIPNQIERLQKEIATLRDIMRSKL